MAITLTKPGKLDSGNIIYSFIDYLLREPTKESGAIPETPGHIYI